MGNIILCHEKKAQNAYEISHVHKRIYTIEELCYYISHNFYLIDKTIVNKQLCEWIQEELGMIELANELKQLLLEKIQVQKFVLTILENVKLYSANEMLRIQDEMNRIKDQKEVERQKCKADNLLENGEIEEAILVYRHILDGERDMTVSEIFYGKVYACIGAAYGRSFLYMDAMKMYDKAFQICNDPALVKCYLYAARSCLQEQEYQLILSQSEVFEELEEIIAREICTMKDGLQFQPSEELVQEWKHAYRVGNK